MENLNVDTYDQIMNRNLNKEYALFALFLNKNNAKLAVKNLKNHGYISSDISLLIPEKKGNHDFVYHQGNEVKVGVYTGAAIGFLIVSLVGIVIGSQSPLHLGWTAWIMDAVLGSVIGLFLGAAAGALVGVGIPKPAARRYGFYLKEGGIVVRLYLRNEDDKNAAYSILEKAGGEDITMLEESQLWTTLTPEKKNRIFH